MADSDIEWLSGGKVWNVTRGCEDESAGCLNCYAKYTAARFCGDGQPYEGLVKIGKRADGSRIVRWTGEVRFVADKLAEPLRWKKPKRIFVDSMSDLFHRGFTNEQIAAVFGVMAACPQHTFVVLTKRAKRMREWFEWVQQEFDAPLETCGREWVSAMALPVTSRSAAGRAVIAPGVAWPLPNVWLGVSVENQAAADERIPELLRTPAAVRFISAEPLLGPLELQDRRGWLAAFQDSHHRLRGEGFSRIRWVIAGCESAGARPCEVDWLRSLRNQCAAAAVPFFLKQAREQSTSLPTYPGTGAARAWRRDIAAGSGSKRKPGGIIGAPYLDGVQHLAFPEVRR